MKKWLFAIIAVLILAVSSLIKRNQTIQSECSRQSGNIATLMGDIKRYKVREIDDGSVEFFLPVLYIAQKWLREIKNLHIEIYRNACGYGYAIVKADSGTWMEDDNSKGPNDGGKWDTYEEALETGIQEVLKLI